MSLPTYSLLRPSKTLLHPPSCLKISYRDLSVSRQGQYLKENSAGGILMDWGDLNNKYRGAGFRQTIKYRQTVASLPFRLFTARRKHNPVVMISVYQLGNYFVKREREGCWGWPFGNNAVSRLRSVFFLEHYWLIWRHFEVHFLLKLWSPKNVNN